MLIDTVMLIVGLVLLIAGSELVVEFAQKLARRLKISELMIGLTILAFGSDLPEIATNIKSGLAIRAGTNVSGIAVGNILGSSLAQITLVAGIAGFITTIYVDKQALKRDGTAMLAAFGLMLLASMDGHISPHEGFFLCVSYLIYLIVLGRILSKTVSSDKTPKAVKKVLNFLHVRPIHEEDIAEEIEELEEELKPSPLFMLRDVIMIGVGIVIVVLGADWVVTHGENIARELSINDVLIGVFLGLGTSLPELAISVLAVKKGAHGISIGNLMGSNIVDPLLALGAGAMVSGFDVEHNVLFFEFPFLLVGTLMALLMLGDHDDLDRSESLSLILFYFLFLFMSFVMFANGCR